MSKPPTDLKLVLSLIAYVFFMVVLLRAVGFGVGVVELLIWLAVLAAGVVLIVRGHLRARRTHDG